MKMTREDFFRTLKEQIYEAKDERELPTVNEVMQNLKDLGMVKDEELKLFRGMAILRGTTCNKVVKFSQTVEAYDYILQEVYGMLYKRRQELLDLWFRKIGMPNIKTSMTKKVKQAYLDGYKDGQLESSSQKDINPWVDDEELRVEGRKGKNAGYNDIFVDKKDVWPYCISDFSIDAYRELKIPWDELGR